MEPLDHPEAREAAPVSLVNSNRASGCRQKNRRPCGPGSSHGATRFCLPEALRRDRKPRTLPLARLKLADGEDTRISGAASGSGAFATYRTQTSRSIPHLGPACVPFNAVWISEFDSRSTLLLCCNCQAPSPFRPMPGYGLDAGECNRPPDAGGSVNHAAQLNEARELLANPEQRANLRLNMLGGPNADQDQRPPDGFLMEMLSFASALMPKLKPKASRHRTVASLGGYRMHQVLHRDHTRTRCRVSL